MLTAMRKVIYTDTFYTCDMSSFKSLNYLHLWEILCYVTQSSDSPGLAQLLS